MKPGGVESLSFRVNIAVDDIGREDMTGVRVGITEKIGQRDSREGIVVAENVFEELHDCEMPIAGRRGLVCFEGIGGILE